VGFLFRDPQLVRRGWLARRALCVHLRPTLGRTGGLFFAGALKSTNCTSWLEKDSTSLLILFGDLLYRSRSAHIDLV